MRHWSELPAWLSVGVPSALLTYLGNRHLSSRDLRGLMGLLLALGGLYTLRSHPTGMSDLIRDRSVHSDRMLWMYSGYSGMDTLLLLAAPRIAWDMVLHHGVTTLWGVVCLHTRLDHGAGIRDLLTECMPFLTMLLARSRAAGLRRISLLVALLRLLVLVLMRLPLYVRVILATLRSSHPNRVNRLALSAVCVALFYLDVSWLPPMLRGFVDVWRGHVSRNMPLHQPSPAS